MYTNVTAFKSKLTLFS